MYLPLFDLISKLTLRRPPAGASARRGRTAGRPDGAIAWSPDLDDPPASG